MSTRREKDDDSVDNTSDDLDSFLNTFSAFSGKPPAPLAATATTVPTAKATPAATAEVFEEEESDDDDDEDNVIAQATQAFGALRINTAETKAKAPAKAAAKVVAVSTLEDDDDDDDEADIDGAETNELFDLMSAQETWEAKANTKAKSTATASNIVADDTFLCTDCAGDHDEDEDAAYLAHASQTDGGFLCTDCAADEATPTPTESGLTGVRGMQRAVSYGEPYHTRITARATYADASGKSAFAPTAAIPTHVLNLSRKTGASASASKPKMKRYLPTLSALNAGGPPVVSSTEASPASRKTDEFSVHVFMQPHEHATDAYVVGTLLEHAAAANATGVAKSPMVSHVLNTSARTYTVNESWARKMRDTGVPFEVALEAARAVQKTLDAAFPGLKGVSASDASVGGGAGVGSVEFSATSRRAPATTEAAYEEESDEESSSE